MFAEVSIKLCLFYFMTTLMHSLDSNPNLIHGNQNLVETLTGNMGVSSVQNNTKHTWFMVLTPLEPTESCTICDKKG